MTSHKHYRIWNASDGRRESLEVPSRIIEHSHGNDWEKSQLRLLDHHHFHETIRRCHDEVTRIFCELHFFGSVLEEYPLFTIVFFVCSAHNGTAPAKDSIATCPWFAWINIVRFAWDAVQKAQWCAKLKLANRVWIGTLPVRYSGAQYLRRQSFKLTPLSWAPSNKLNSTTGPTQPPSEKPLQPTSGPTHPTTVDIASEAQGQKTSSSPCHPNHPERQTTRSFVTPQTSARQWIQPRHVGGTLGNHQVSIIPWLQMTWWGCW